MMTDTKTIMSFLEGLAEPDWRIFHSDSEVQTIAKETLNLLKEQETRIKKFELEKGWDESPDMMGKW